MDRKYQIALINVPFDNTYSNTIRFDTRTEQEEYFNVNNLSFSAPINFNFGSLLETSVVYRDNSITSIDLLNKNYAIIKETINGISKYLYFFIRRAVFDTLSQINVGLELDVIQTFYIDLNFQDCIIEKAHLDRFVNDGGLYKFNNRDDSPLFVREDIKDISKRVIHREKIHFQYDTNLSSLSGLTPFNTWIKDNVLAWVYIYVANTKDSEDGEDNIGYKTYEWKSSDEENPQEITSQFTTHINFPTGTYKCPYSILCYPLLKPGAAILLKHRDIEYRYTIMSLAFQDFLDNNNGGANILQIKFSAIAPFTPSNYVLGNDYNIVDGNLELNCVPNIITGGINWKGVNVVCTGNINIALFNVYQQDYKPLKSIRYNTHTIARKYFSATLKSAAGVAQKDTRYNPKLHNSDYMSLRVCAEGNYFDYDYQKMGSETNIYFLYSEVFTPDITRGYLRLATSHWSDSIYGPETEHNYMGLVFSQDYSLPYSRNQLDVFLANNKNFYQQRNLQRTQQIVDTSAGFIGGAGKAVSSAFVNPAAAVGTGIETVANTGAAVSQIITDRIQSNLTLDNMRSAPEQLANSNGNALLNMFVTEIGMYFEIHRGLDSELKIANDIMYKNGYTYNQVDNIKNVDNIRQYFNYVVAHIDNINSPLSNEIKAKIRSIFSNGIRFWNLTDEMFKFEKENFERYLYE